MNHEDNRFEDPRIMQGLRFGAMEFVPADNYVISPDAPTLLIMAPAGAIDVLMPASTPERRGLTFIIMNASANIITAKTSADAAFTVAIAIAANTSAIVTCTGSATAASGWRAVSTI